MPQAQSQPQYLSMDPNAGTPVPVPVPSHGPASAKTPTTAGTPATPQYLSMDPNAGTTATSPPPRPPVAARGTRGTPPYISDETSRLIGGMTGAAAAGAAVSGLGWIPATAAGAGLAVRSGLALARAIPSVVGAYGGGATVAAAQGAPPSEIHAAGKEQAGYEIGGKVAAAPVNWILKRVAAKSIYTAASKKLRATKQYVTDQLRTALDSAKRLVEDATTTQATAAVQSTARVAETKAAGRQGVETAQDVLSTVKEAGKQARTAARQRFATTPPPATTTGQVGRQAAAVLDRGTPLPGAPPSPVKQSFEQIGKRVKAALDVAPDQEISAIRKEAQDILNRETVLPREGGAATETFGVGPRGVPMTPPPGGTFKARLAAAKAAADIPPPAPEMTPIPSPSRTALLRIVQMPDTVTAAQLHEAATALNDAAKWDKGISTQGMGRARHMYAQIRAKLGAASPEFHQAAGEYAAASTLYENSLAPHIVELAQSNPDAVAKLLKVEEPERLKLLRQVFFKYGGESGQQAWNALRSHVVYDHFIEGGLDKLNARLADPKAAEFLTTLTNDADGKLVIDNLRRIGQGFDHLLATTSADLRAAQAGVRTAQRTRTHATTLAQGAQRATAQATAARLTAAKGQVTALEQGTKTAEAAMTETEVALTEALGDIPGGAQTLKDLATLGGATIGAGVAHHFGGPYAGSAFGGASVLWIYRHRAAQRLLQSPVMADLVQWASFAPARTQMLVQALNSPAPGMMLADLLRASRIHDIQREKPMASHASTQPPPGSAATPPPAPPR